MATVRVFQNPDGTVSVMRLNPRRAVTFESETAKNQDLAALPFFDLDESQIPIDRTNRHKWRIKAGKLEVEQTVPDPPDPKAALKGRIAAANSVADIKLILRDIV